MPGSEIVLQSETEKPVGGLGSVTDALLPSSLSGKSKRACANEAQVICGQKRTQMLPVLEAFDPLV